MRVENSLNPTNIPPVQGPAGAPKLFQSSSLSQMRECTDNKKSTLTFCSCIADAFKWVVDLIKTFFQGLCSCFRTETAKEKTPSQSPTSEVIDTEWKIPANLKAVLAEFKGFKEKVLEGKKNAEKYVFYRDTKSTKPGEISPDNSENTQGGVLLAKHIDTILESEEKWISKAFHEAEGKLSFKIEYFAVPKKSFWGSVRKIPHWAFYFSSPMNCEHLSDTHEVSVESEEKLMEILRSHRFCYI